jgi:hypothetical protein
MPNIISPTIVVLWEHELIAAAKSLAPFAKGGKPSEKDAENMMRACFAALYSPELVSGEHPVTIMNCRETVIHAEAGRVSSPLESVCGLTDFSTSPSK